MLRLIAHALQPLVQDSCVLFLRLHPLMSYLLTLPAVLTLLLIQLIFLFLIDPQLIFQPLILLLLMP